MEWINGKIKNICNISIEEKELLRKLDQAKGDFD